MTGSSRDDAFAPGSNLTWFLFDDPVFSHEIFRCDRVGGNATQSCLTPGLAASTTYYLRVDENDGIGQNFTFVLYNGTAPLTPSSVQAPVAIPIGSDGISVVQDNTLSTGFYAFVTAQAGTYRITSDLATGDGFALVAWSLYDDAAFSHQIARCYKPGPFRTDGTVCTVSLAGSTPFYLKVEAVDDLPAIGSNDLRLIVVPEYKLMVTLAGPGAGTVTSSDGNIDCGATCTATYAEGTMVTLTARPSLGSSFAGWSGGGCIGTGTCTVTISAPTSVTATFQ